MENVYDRILKEIIEPLFKPLTQILMGIPVDQTREIKDKIQYTLEREGDHLKMLVFEDAAHNNIVHYEFHGKDEKMGEIMALKKFMLKLKLGLPVKQAVVYLGNKKKLKHLKPFYQDENTRHTFEVIHLNQISFRHFLNSGVAEAVLLTILCDFEGEKPVKIIERILEKLHELSPNAKVAGQHTIRLEVLSKLRKLQALTVEKNK